MSDNTDYRHTATAGGNKPTGKKDKSQATRLIELAAQAKLFHDQEGRGYATIFVAGHKETWPVKSKGFKDWMRQEFYACEKRGVNGSALQDAIETVEGQARFDAPEKSAHLRLAEHDGKIYIDLCDPSWRAIEITAHGWQVISEPPVKFVRAPGMIALPEPVRGDINRIFDYLNVAKQDCCLVLVWLMGAMRPTGPYPILILQGEQDTAKSTAAKVLRSLVDPSAVPLRTQPRKEEDLIIAAHNSWLIALDNLSGLAPWLSDGLCRIATGGGFGTRELYTNKDESLIDVQRPTILNGIDDIATRQDLIDRSIIINLEFIPDNKRKEESEFWQSFNATKPAILGTLVDRVSRALCQLPTTHRDTLPRMADFAKWATAAVPQDEKDTFIKEYRANRQSAVVSGLEGSPVHDVLQEMINKDSPFEGTATELLNTLNARIGNRTPLPQSWPKESLNNPAYRQ